MMTRLQIWSNTRLDAASSWPVDTLADLFAASPHYRKPGDLADRLRLFLTDQDGPVRGVCCDEQARAELLTVLAARETASASGRDTTR
jgi:hypothetical protein